MQQQDVYSWAVLYQDDTSLEEKDTARGFSSVDQRHVKSVVLITSNGEREHCTNVPANAMPVFFRRRTLEINPNAGEERRGTTHCIGWRRDNSASYLFVFDDGSTLLTDDLQAV